MDIVTNFQHGMTLGVFPINNCSLITCLCRCNRAPSLVSYADHWEVRLRLAESYQLNQIVAAMRGPLVLVVLYLWQSLQYQASFLLIDTAADEIVSYFQSPMPNMSIVECKISPDGSKVGVLFYSKKDVSSPFQYSLYLFSADTGQVVDVVECNKEVRPYVTFDPKFGSSRLAIVNYSNEKTGHINSLVMYGLDIREVIATSHVILSLICGIGYFCANFSRDGNFLVLQKIMESMNRGYCYTDSYVFDTSSLKLLKHFYANLQPLSTVCDSNYAPTFSKCGGRMCMLSEENTGEPRLHISVYQLPHQLSLQQMCRRTVVRSLCKMADVDALPLPHKLKLFLKFSPQEP